jgi:hypothetical protein
MPLLGEIMQGTEGLAKLQQAIYGFIREKGKATREQQRRI